MILILLLTPSTAQNKNRYHSLKKLYSWTITKNTTINENNEHEQELTMKCLYHYLHSLKIQAIDLSDKVLIQLYDENKIHDGDNIEKRLKRLCEFLNQIFDKDKRLFKNLLSTANNENQQYLVKLSKKILNHNDTDTKKIENDFDMETCCILLTTEDDIKLFYSRICTFTNLIFVVIDIDKIHHRLRKLILNEQDQLSKLQTQHATVYYFSRELTLRKISTLIKFDDNQTVEVPISNRNITITELLTKFSMTTTATSNEYKYLATMNTHQIIENNQEIVSNLCETKLLLVKDETCLVSVEKLSKNCKNKKNYKRFLMNSTISDVYKQCQISNFKCIQFNCSHSITCERLCQISCLLFKENVEFYALEYDGSEMDAT
ncbi:unnamed protein product, partial [Didymodactylos carnosus]